MKRLLIPALLIAMLASCKTSKKAVGSGSQVNSGSVMFSGGDGSSYEQAVIINETREMAGVDAEYNWLKKNYPGYKSQEQALNYFNKKPYDIITILTTDGEEKKIYFDISRFFGKF